MAEHVPLIRYPIMRYAECREPQVVSCVCRKRTIVRFDDAAQKFVPDDPTWCYTDTGWCCSYDCARKDVL